LLGTYSIGPLLHILEWKLTRRLLPDAC